MRRIVHVEAKPGYRVYVRFASGEEGLVDLSHLAGRGVFSRWLEPGQFELVRLGSWGGLVWGEELDLCPDALFERLTGTPLAEDMEMPTGKVA